MSIVQDTIQNDAGEDITIYIEVDTQPVDHWNDTRGIADQAQNAQDAFKKATTLIHTCAEQIAQSIHTIPAKIKPHEFEAQFSIKFNAEWGAVIAKTSAEAQIQVTLKWCEKD